MNESLKEKLKESLKKLSDSDLKQLLKMFSESEMETINIAMTASIEGELYIYEEDGWTWEYNGQKEGGLKSREDAIKSFKREMKRQGFRNIKIGDLSWM